MEKGIDNSEFVLLYSNPLPSVRYSFADIRQLNMLHNIYHEAGRLLQV